MAISIDPQTHVILVPRADLPLASASPEIRTLDLNLLKAWLKDWEDDEQGVAHPKTHDHDTERTLSGLVYARKIIILAPYTVEFEDGQYTVNCIGANHNLADVKVPNQVSIVVNNAAGLIIGEGADPADVANAVWEDLIADHTVPGTYGAEMATKADIAAGTATDYTTATTGSVIYGTEDAGTFASATVRDNSYWQIGETGPGGDGLTAEMTFNLPCVDCRPGAVEMFGRYEGVPSTTHYMNVWAYNYEAAAWETLVEPCMPGGNTSDDTYAHEYYERHVDRDNNNEVKIRFVHNSATYIDTHNLYLDYVAVSSINVVTAADIADAVWDEDLTTHSTADSAAVQLSITRKLLTNRLELVDGTTNNWVLYDDNNTVLMTFSVTYKDGVAIAQSSGIPSRRTKGV